jgi:hypothetical protein
LPYIPSEWNTLRDRAMRQNPDKMTGLSVLGKYVSKMKLNQFKEYDYAHSAEACERFEGKDAAKAEDIEA